MWVNASERGLWPNWAKKDLKGLDEQNYKAIVTLQNCYKK